MAKVKPIPEGYHTLTTYLVVRGADKAIDFYKRAFGAVEVFRMPDPQGRIMHAELKIGGSMLMLSEEMPMGNTRAPETLGGTTCQVFVYVEDCDKTINQASAAGAKVDMPAADMFWGDRYGKLTDPFGHSWGIATHKEEVSAEEMGRRATEFFKQMAEQQRAKTAS
jgi:PhnB protein